MARNTGVRASRVQIGGGRLASPPFKLLIRKPCARKFSEERQHIEGYLKNLAGYSNITKG